MKDWVLSVLKVGLHSSQSSVELTSHFFPERIPPRQYSLYVSVPPVIKKTISFNGTGLKLGTEKASQL